MMIEEWTLRSHFLNGSLPKDILQALIPHQNSPSSQAVEKECEMEKIYQPPVALTEANSCIQCVPERVRWLGTLISV